MDKTITVDKLNLFYQEHGKGEKSILLLHGWGQSHAFWKDFISRFAKDYHIYVLDLPGFGLSQEPLKTWKIEDYASFVRAFVTELKIDNPIIIGHSFGGRIAIVYTSKFPVKKLILYSTGGGVPERSPLKIVNKYVIVGVGKYLFPNFLYQCYSIYLRPKAYENKVLINKKRSRRMLDIYSQPPQYLQDSIKKISVETLIVVGKKDFITKPAIGIKIHKLIRNSQLVEIREATHFAHLEAPGIFYDAVEKFLEDRMK
ncbi:MAG: alpha/beta hydrolase [Patescibacteria group bacterium]